MQKYYVGLGMLLMAPQGVLDVVAELVDDANHQRELPSDQARYPMLALVAVSTMYATS